ncbi:hypothetical protein ACILPN_07080 [Yersinia wautersii]|uniref:Uncharacterized protein n=1 Tax=Yersinia pseudotuberculosis TaxID=633 RepID=A0A380Q4M3_YERPU|nr:hypothetical protein [Yersinia pseudotuberculosis]SUP80452.1 Uncharacterised protein [Yersinia pseudotuberculosis]
MNFIITYLPEILRLNYSTTTYSDTKPQEYNFTYQVEFPLKGDALYLILTEIESTEKSALLSANRFTPQLIADYLVSAHNNEIYISTIINKG